jgi:hypothetical protein
MRGRAISSRGIHRKHGKIKKRVADLKNPGKPAKAGASSDPLPVFLAAPLERLLQKTYAHSEDVSTEKIFRHENVK